MSDKTFVFTPEGGNSGGSKFDIMAMLPGLMGGKNGLDPNLVAALMNGNNNRNNWGGEGCWWLWIILLFFCWGGNGLGFGNRDGLPAGLNGDAGRELLMNAIQGNGNAINQLASSLNCSTQQLQNAICNIQGQIQQVGNQVGMSSQQIINAVQSGNCQLLNQIAECCCTTNNNITKMGYENQLASCNQTNTLVNTMNNNTLSLRDGNQANTNAILAKLDAMQNQALQDKIAALTAERATLQAEISQRNQNATILNAVGQQVAPLAAGLQALREDVDGIKMQVTQHGAGGLPQHTGREHGLVPGCRPTVPTPGTWLTVETGDAVVAGTGDKERR